MGRRRAAKAPSKRRWLRYGIIVGILLLFVIVYETGQQLRRSDTGREQQSAAPGAEEAVDPEDSVRRLKRYYHSHDLPAGWEVGDTERADSGSVEVEVYFSPGLRSSRHGEAARPGEIGPHNACPTEESELWGELAEATFEIEVNDKTGVIDRFACTPPTPAGSGSRDPQRGTGSMITSASPAALPRHWATRLMPCAFSSDDISFTTASSAVSALPMPCRAASESHRKA